MLPGKIAKKQNKIKLNAASKAPFSSGANQAQDELETVRKELARVRSLNKKQILAELSKQVAAL